MRRDAYDNLDGAPLNDETGESTSVMSPLEYGQCQWTVSLNPFLPCCVKLFFLFVFFIQNLEVMRGRADANVLQ